MKPNEVKAEFSDIGWGIIIIKVSLRGDYGTMLIFTSDMTLDLRCYTYYMSEVRA